MNRVLFYVCLLCIMLSLTMTGCVEENVSYDPELELYFSCDTLVFDTLFAGQPSVTKRVMIYNRNKRALEISSVRMGGADSSDFRFNVDGRIAGRGEVLENIVIKGKDSLYVLVETTPHEAADGRPFTVSFDSLLFECNGRQKDVKLIAVGRDAVLLRNYSLTYSETFSPTRPYLVFGYLHVPEDVKLSLPAGTELYMHGGANLVVDGAIECNGTFEQPVLIRGDRFDRINDVDETPYDQMSDQWGGIYLQNPQSEYRFENTVIRGSSAGIMLFGTQRGMPSLVVRNSVIHNSGTYGIYSQMGDVVVENSEISNCGESCLVAIGGNVYMVHTTVANYFRFVSRSTPSVRFIGYVMQNGVKQNFPFGRVVVENSIIFGANREELEVVQDTLSTSGANILFSHTLIKGREVVSPQFYNCRWARSQNLKNAVDTVFANTSVANIAETGYYDFRLDSLSFARSCASLSVATLYPIDLDGNSRNRDGKPDIGAYEF